MRAAGIDLGRVRVGLAIADELGMLAHPRPHLDGRDPKRLLARLREIAEGEKITCFVIGLPATLRGEEGAPARRVRRFAGQLESATGTRVVLVDERLSTVEAHGRLRAQGLDTKRARDRVDSAAAAILLQSWLDSQKPELPRERD